MLYAVLLRHGTVASSLKKKVLLNTAATYCRHPTVSITIFAVRDKAVKLLLKAFKKNYDFIIIDD